MTRSGLFLAGAAVLATLGLTAPLQSARASTLYTSAGTLNNGTWEALSLTVNGQTDQGIPAGQFNLTTSYSANYANSFNVSAWCIDFLHSIGLPGGPFTFTSAPVGSQGAGSATPDNLPALSATQLQNIGWLAKLGNAALTTNYSDVLSAEYQVAIWDIEYGAANVSVSALFDFNGSSYSVDNTNTVTTFNAGVTNILNSIPNTPIPGGNVELISGGSGGGNQTLLVFVPEPASMAVLGVGMLGMGLARRRRRVMA